MRIRRIAASVVFFAYAVGIATPAYADRVETRHTTQVFTRGYTVPDLRLRTLATDYVSDAQVPPVPSKDNSQPHFETVVETDFSILSLQQDPLKGNQPTAPTVETTVCDCADLMIPVAGEFPKWPLLFLAAVPLIFLKGGEEELPPTDTTPTPTPTPTPPPQIPTPTPEPTSLLLLLTGVCAVGVRLRKSVHWSKRD